MKNRILTFLTGVLLLAACDNTLDINAPYRETPVVYAIIDMGQDSQIFRIQKTYQNDVNKTTDEVAQIADSLYMKNITVKVVSGNNPNLFREFKRLAPRKEAGFFSNKDSSYWGQRTTGFFTPGSSYTLRIKNNETDKEYIATTTATGMANIRFGSPINFIESPNGTFSYQVEQIGDNVFIFDLIVRLNYWEINKITNDSSFRNIDYYLRRDALYTSVLNGKVTIGVSKQGLLGHFTSNLPVNAAVTRRFNSIESVVIGSNKDYSDMIQTNKPSGSIIPKVSDYSNISNGIGVFASRTITKLKQSVTDQSIDLLNAQVLNK
jgi:hypothetical protein